MKKEKYIGRIFPGGNTIDCIILFKYLMEKHVKFQVYSDGKGGAAFLLKREELVKLPQWEGETFLPTSDRGDAGFSYYNLTKELLRETKLYEGV
jgi:hypothetical protein